MSAAIFFFVLAVGAFITVTMKTESIQTGIGRLALRYRHSGSVLVAILMSRETGVPIKQLIVMNKAELIGAIEQSERHTRKAGQRVNFRRSTAGIQMFCFRYRPLYGVDWSASDVYSTG